jgi:hypothetical protein
VIPGSRERFHILIGLFECAYLIGVESLLLELCRIVVHKSVLIPSILTCVFARVDRSRHKPPNTLWDHIANLVAARQA